MAKIDTTALINAVRLKVQGSNPSAPAATYQLLFVKSDGVYTIDSSSAVTKLFGGSPVREAIFTVEGVLTVAAGVVRIYNKLGASVTISQVFCAVNTAPTGANLIVDILKNATTIFTGGTNRPVILATANTGTTTTIDVPTWADGDYLTMDVAQVGATIAGSNLTVHVIYS